jgi:hypothetical protein
VKKIIEWLKEHARPTFAYKPHADDCPDMYEEVSWDNSLEDNFENFKENMEVGFKITFKF